MKVYRYIGIQVYKYTGIYRHTGIQVYITFQVVFIAFKLFVVSPRLYLIL